MRNLILVLPILMVVLPCAGGPPDQAASPAAIRVGLIGLDTSHAIEFTRMLNDAGAKDHVPGARVVAAFKGGSPDLEASASRVENYTADLRDKWKLEIVPDIPTLCSKVDAVLLLSVDGRKHLEQVKPVFAARKRVFIDKPLAASLGEAREIARLGAEAGVPWFSASSLRFHPSVQSLKQDVSLGAVIGCDIYSPAALEPHHPDLYWYGVHGVEMLFTLMGPGCESVARTHTAASDVVVGRWRDGRLGVYRGMREGDHGYGATVYGAKRTRTNDPIKGSPYGGLVVEIVKFFQTGAPPLSAEETLEIFAFMQAAEVSKEREGRTVSLSELAGR
jgi:hypothetical protein